VDRLMALRVLNYEVSFYMELAGNLAGKKLPPVFPIVLYNGDGRWTAATDVADLIEAEPLLGEYALHFRYFKLAENEQRRETLLQIGNIVSTLFLAEGRYDLEQMLAELVALFDREEDKRAVSLLINWFRQMAVHKRIRQEDFALLEEAYRSSEEIQTMLVKTLEQHEQAVYEKGLAKGLEEGREEVWAKIARAMKGKGFGVDVISDLLGITAADVEKLLARQTPDESTEQ